jgi:hypothetical protein
MLRQLDSSSLCENRQQISSNAAVVRWKHTKRCLVVGSGCSALIVLVATLQQRVANDVRQNDFAAGQQLRTRESRALLPSPVSALDSVVKKVTVGSSEFGGKTLGGLPNNRLAASVSTSDACPNPKFASFEPHTGETAEGDLCRRTNKPMGPWICPVGCVEKLVGEPGLKYPRTCVQRRTPGFQATAHNDTLCRVKETECQQASVVGGQQRWPVAIPRRLHFVRKDRDLQDPKDIDLKKNAERTIAMFKHESQNYDGSRREEQKQADEGDNAILIWTDTECVGVITEVYPAALPMFHKAKEGMYKADVCRYALLYKYGGLYVDDDIEFVESPFAPLHCSDQFVVPLEPGKKAMFQAYIAVRAKHPVMLTTLASIARENRVSSNRKYLKNALDDWDKVGRGTRRLIESKINKGDRLYTGLGSNCDCVVRNSEWNVFFRSHVAWSHSCSRPSGCPQCYTVPPKKYDWCIDNNLPLSVPLPKSALSFPLPLPTPPAAP